MNNTQIDYSIYLINLDRDINRLERARERFASFDLSFERVSGVDGSKVDALTRFFSQIPSRSLSDGELGCALSHISVWQKIASGDVDNALVLEDDAAPIRAFPLRFAELDIPEDYDLCYANNRMIYKKSTFYKDTQKTVPVIQAMLEFNKDSKVQAAGLDGYFLSRKGARRLLDIIRQDRIIAPIDGQVMVVSLNGQDLDLLANKLARRGATFKNVVRRRAIKDTIRAYVLTPSLVKQDDGGVSTRMQVTRGLAG
ncbi:glycosyltransferase family 25 protein [Methylobacterium sp.]|uniref:glycosyltransferase family 25 protein n=1 Tax=Methylobacterium sp. TaxID=409 RepID=UPI003B01F4A3